MSRFIQSVVCRLLTNGCCVADVHADETPEGESDRDRRVEEHSLGCKIDDLKYLVPLTSKPLGGAFWKCEKHGTTLCDVDAGSIFGSVCTALLPSRSPVL